MQRANAQRHRRVPASCWGESKANPNRSTWQQRKTRAAASFGLGSRSLRFECAKPLAQNPAESRHFPGRLALLPKSLCGGRLGGGASRIRTLSTPRRIWSESEPPNLPTEKNVGCCAFEAPNPPSPVRMRESPTGRTPRNRANFPECSRVQTRSLRVGRLGGGGDSLMRTRLWVRIPDLQGNYRETPRI